MRIMQNLDKIVALSKNRGFIYPGSEIYGGLANTWDFGPLGVELKNNIKREWWKFFVRENRNSIGMDGGILMNPMVWKASGHVDTFQDPLMDCKDCKHRSRVDKLIEESGTWKDTKKRPEELSLPEMEKFVFDNKIKCPACGKVNWTGIRFFKLMFSTDRGVTEANLNTIYLRPETAQSQFVNFQNLQRSSRLKVPFGVGQIGKAFRNEITPGNFIFRTVEFEQMEYQLFCKEEESMKWYDIYKKKAHEFYTKRLGITDRNIRFADHDNLAHYAKAAVDAEYLFPFGWGEIGGTHHRGIFDLGNHQRDSKKTMEYKEEGQDPFVPTVIESSHGLDRILLATLVDAYNEEEVAPGDTRVLMKLKPSIAPYTVAVLPLQKRGLTDKSHELFDTLSKNFSVSYDETGSIGKRYRRQDEIGTPLCLTVDYETLEDNSVTIRDRDTMKQERIRISDLIDFINRNIV